MVTAEEVAETGIPDRLREDQRVSRKSSVVVPTKIVNVVELARDGFDLKRKNATMSDQQTNLEAHFGENSCSLAYNTRSDYGC